MRQRVMFVITGLNLGGAESQLVLLVRELRRIGWEVVVVSMIEPKYFVEDFRDIGVNVITLQMSPSMPDVRALFKLARLVKSWRPAIIHSHMVHANIFTRVARMFFPRIALVSTAHNIDELEGSRGRFLAYRLTRQWSSYTSSVSVSAFQKYVSLKLIDSSKGGFVPNGVDLERFAFNAARRNALRRALDVGDRFVWLAIGRLVPAKDFANLIAAVAQLRDDGHPAMRVLLAGEGPEGDTLRRMCVKDGLTDIIHFLGPRHDVPDLLSAADALVLSSAWEGLPMVILEAMAASRMVVATNVGGVSELFPQRDVDVLVPPGNPAALAARMATTMALRAEALTEAGRQSRAFVENNFDIRKVARDWDAIYRRLADGSASTRPASRTSPTTAVPADE